MQTARVNPHLLLEMKTNTGENLRAISDQQPVMLIFLRHFGCTFCRESLSDIAQKQDNIEQGGTRIVFVHMTKPHIAKDYFKRYNIRDAVHISDPNCQYYKAFGLTKGTFNQLFGLQSWLRGFDAGVIRQHWVGKQLGDGFQMPGIFMLQEGEIRERFVHKLASDRPDYEKMVLCCASYA